MQQSIERRNGVVTNNLTADLAYIKRNNKKGSETYLLFRKKGTLPVLKLLKFTKVIFHDTGCWYSRLTFILNYIKKTKIVSCFKTKTF